MSGRESSQPPCQRALVLYEHALLGAGLAEQLQRSGVDVRAVSVEDPDAIAAALALRPCLVVAEHVSPWCVERINAASPAARVIDVSEVVARGCPDSADVLHFEAILAALDALPAPSAQL